MYSTWYPLAIAFVSLASAESGGGLANDTVYSTGVVAEITTDPADSYPGSWVSDLFYRALANYTVRDVGSTACRTQTAMYERNLRNYTSWAVRMAESWERHPIGTLGGNKYHFGIYDECVNVHFPIKGQYCLSEIKLTSLSKKDYSLNQTEELDYFDNGHSWNTVLGWIDYPDQVQRNRLNLGICIPDSCTALDLELSLQNDLDKVFRPEQVNAVVTVHPIMCTVSGDMYPYDTFYYVTSAIFVFLILLCSSATIYHFIELSRKEKKKETNTSFYSIFYSFSIIESGKGLLKYDKNNELNIINGFKVLVMIFILFGHRFMFLGGNPISYSKSAENIFLEGPDILLTNMNLVDPFFYISGLLMHMTVIPVFLNKGSFWIQFTSPIIYRLLRMLPAYCAIMAIMAHILPHLGDGPLWPLKMWPEAQNCKNYWWMNLLFINNFIDSKYQCLLMSWYISCDIQFYILGVVFIYIYTKSVKFCIWLLSAMIGISFFVPFIVTLLTGSDGILKVHLPFLENPRSSLSFNETYRPSHMRAIPFFIGLAMGIIVKMLKETKPKFSNKTVYGVTFITVVMCFWVQFYGAIFYKRNRPYYPLEHALYATLSHCSYTMICVCVTVFHFTTGYGILTNVLSNRFIVPLGRLSYSVFLVNLIVMVMSQSSQRLPNVISAKLVIDAWIYDTFKSYLMGLILYLVVEAPFGNLTRMLFGRGQKKSEQTTFDISIVRPSNTETYKNDNS